MESTFLYGPFLTQIGLTLVVLLWLAFGRVSNIRKFGMAEIKKNGFPPYTVNASDNYKNQFELPILFYALCLFFMHSGTVTPLIYATAWVFVIARILHAAVQLSINIIFPYRFGFFVISACAIIVMFISAVLQVRVL